MIRVGSEFVGKPVIFDVHICCSFAGWPFWFKLGQLLSRAYLMRASYELLTPTPTERLLAEKLELVCPLSLVTPFLISPTRCYT